jgi:hypothetical protein
LLEPVVRAAVLDAFSFARRDLAQPLHRSEVLAVIGSVPGVAWADIEVFTAVSELMLPSEIAQTIAAALPRAERVERTPPDVLSAWPGGYRPLMGANLPADLPAQLVYLTAAVPETLVLRMAPT